jgi:long-chain fatty acid transport protein
MSFKRCVRYVAPIALLLFASTPVHATDGHFLHGVGAVNSAMGGAGVAAPGDLLGSFYLNPAGLVCEHGTRISLGFEMMKPERTVTSEFGGFTGSTTSKADFTPIPAFGLAARVNEKVSLGIGMLGIGGFGVDYPADPANPVLGPRPQGFGQVASNFQFMKIAPSIAYTVNEDFYVGAAVNFDWASLSVDPMPIAPPAIDPGTGTAYYSRATATDGSFGVGFQAGLIYKATDMLRVGLSYTSPQWFQDFEFNAVYENPELPDFQTHRDISFAMDVPAVYSGGLAADLGRFLWTGDARYITYSSTDGFAESGMNPDGSVRGFGWDDIWVLASGLQFRPVERLALRGGYNYTQNPIPPEQSAANVPAPAIVQHHATFGLGYRFGDLTVDAGYYRAFKNDLTGQMMTPNGPITVTNEMYEDSFLLTFSFAPSGM